MLEGSKRLLMKLKFLIVLLLALAPSLAVAKPKTATAHMHPQLFRDRAPKVRVHETRTTRQGRTSPAKTPQGEPF
jgi:hypothetical protein